MIERTRTIALRYGAALAAAAVAAAARVALDPLLGSGPPFVTFILALAVVATLVGFGPSLVVIAGGVVFFATWFRAPRYAYALPGTTGWTTLAAFLAIGGAVSALCASLRAARNRAEAVSADLRREVERRERVDAELRDRETRWRTLIENNTDAIALMTSDAKLLYISPAVTRITGFAPEEVLGSNGLGYVHPEDRERSDRAWMEVLARPGERILSEIRIRHRDGSWRRVETVGTNYLAEPAIAAVVINARDVTERAAIEETLRTEQARFNAFMDHSPALAYLKDEAGRYIWGNRAWASQFDRPVEALIGLDDFALWPEETARTFRESDRLALESGLIQREEAVDDRHFFSLKFALEHRGARLVGGKTLDITDRVRAQKELERSEALLVALADSMPQIVWAARPDGVLDYFNRRWFEYTGLTREASLSDEGWAAILHPDDVDRTREVWYASVRSGGPYEIEYRFKDRRGGGYRWHLGRALPVRDGSGAIIRWYGTCTDIDDQKRAEAAAHAANASKDRFLAVLSHELRTPLTPILLVVSALQDDPALPDEMRPSLEMIRRNIGLESRLIDDLLDVTRIVQGTLKLRPEPCDAHRVIEHALGACRAELEAAGVGVALDFRARSGRVVADPARLQQVFWNLFKNAAKFSPQGGTLTVRTGDDRDRGRLIVEVADTGVGIDPAALSRIFGAFEQAEESPWTRKFGGLGLGLAISRTIVEEHGGSLSARSDGPGRGATFRVEVPVAPGGASGRGPSRAANGRDDTPEAPARRILLVEDDPMTLSTLSRLLRLGRHEVTTARDVASALRAAEGAPDGFDLIISDIGLPDGDGVSLMRTLRSGPHRAMPAIALSGFGTEDDIRRSLDAGFLAHLVKPIDFRSLETTIREVLA